MDSLRIDCRRLAAALWRRPEARVEVTVTRRRSGYTQGMPWRAAVISRGDERTAYLDPGRQDLTLDADAQSEHAALAALREHLLHTLAVQAESLTKDASQHDRLAGEARAQAHDVAALVASTRRAMAEQLAGGDPCPS